MSLYDNYQLANSTGTPAYVGSALQEKIGVLSTLQQRADQSQYNDDMLSRTAQDAMINEQDRPLYEQVVSKYRDNINARAKSGNYEDMQMATSRDAYNYASDFKAFGRNFGLTQARIADIKKMSERGADGKAGIGSETADALMREVSSYSGLKKDADGNYTNYYQGAAIAPDVDVAGKVKSWASDIVARETGQEVKSMQEGSDGQMHYITIGGKTGVVTSDQIKNAINYGSQSDQGFKDYLHQKQRLETNGLDRVTYEDMAKDPKAKDTADTIKAEADRQGTTFGKLYRQIKAEQIKNDVASNAYNYGMKYVKNDSERKWLDDGLTESASKKLTDQTQNVALLYQGPDVQFQPKMKDPQLLTTAADQANYNIGNIAKQLGNPNLDPRDRSMLLNQLDDAKNQKTSAESILNGAKEATAKKMGYPDYAAVQAKILPALTSNIPATAQGYSPNGKIVNLTQADITKAIMDNKLKMTGPIIDKNRGSKPGYYELETPTGPVMIKDVNTETKIKNALDAVQEINGPFHNKLEDEIKTNAEHYGYKPLQVALPDKDSQEFSKAYKVNPGAFEIRANDDPTEPVKDKDKPIELDFGSVHTIKQGGNVVMQARGKDAKGKLTDQYYTVQPVGVNNFNDVVASAIEKKGDINSRVAAASLRANGWNGAVANLQNTEAKDITLPNSTGNDLVKLGTVRRETTPLGQPVYNIYNSSGQKVRTYSDPDEAGKAIQTMVDHIRSQEAISGK